VQEDTLHVLIVVRVTMTMVMVSVIVSVTVMGVAESSETHDVDEEAQNTDNQKFV